MFVSGSVAALVLLALLLAGRGWTAAGRDRTLGVLGALDQTSSGRKGPARRSRLREAFLGGRLRRAASAVTLAMVGSPMGFLLAGPPGLLVFGIVGAVLPLALGRRSERRRVESLDQQLSETTESLSLALRSGLSVRQAVEHAATEAESPMAEILGRVVEEQRLGIPLEEALDRFASAVGTDDARMLVLIVGMHARSGGDLAEALNEVVATMRHRLAVRRELRGLTAQGRLSGVILGSVPIGFFLFLAVTSRAELAPVYRSTAGTALVGAGLLLEGLAFLWIRRLLRIEV